MNGRLIGLEVIVGHVDRRLDLLGEVPGQAVRLVVLDLGERGLEAKRAGLQLVTALEQRALGVQQRGCDLGRADHQRRRVVVADARRGAAHQNRLRRLPRSITAFGCIDGWEGSFAIAHDFTASRKS